MGGRGVHLGGVVAREVPPTCTAIGPDNKLIFAPRALGWNQRGQLGPDLGWGQVSPDRRGSRRPTPADSPASIWPSWASPGSSSRTCPSRASGSSWWWAKNRAELLPADDPGRDGQLRLRSRAGQPARGQVRVRDHRPGRGDEAARRVGGLHRPGAASGPPRRAGRSGRGHGLQGAQGHRHRPRGS